MHVLGYDRFAWDNVKAERGEGRDHLRCGSFRVNASRLVPIHALHNAANFE
jgi:hypothetical protein